MNPTLVVDPARLGGAELRLAGSDHHHLVRVRRLGVGDPVRVVDGLGGAWFARLTQIGRRDALLVIEGEAPANEASVRVELVVGTFRRERASWLVEKATEVGVTAIRFVASERAPRRFGEATFDRLRRVARSAVEQCGRSRLPELTGIHSWDEVADLLENVEEPWFLDPGASEPLTTAAGSAALWIGPEGGWSDSECATLVEAGCRAAGLGDRVLRVETAAVVGAARLLLA